MKRLRPAVELEGEIVGREVSCGVFTGLFATARDRGLDLEELVAGTGFCLAHFQDPTERVSWQAVQQICERAGRLWSTEELRAVGARSIDIQHFEPQIFLARLLLRPTEAYDFVIRGDGQGDFACLAAKTTVDGHHVDIEIEIAPGYGHSPSLFWILCGAAEAVPMIFGLRPAEVELVLHDRGAHLSVEVPPGGGRWSWLDRLRRGVWRRGGIDAVGERLSQRTAALETAVAKRLTVETELKDALDEHHRRLANANDVVVELDPDGSVTFVSSNVERVLGVSEHDFCSEPLRFLELPSDEPSTPWMARMEMTGRWIEVNPSRSSDEGSTSTLLVVRDVTERVDLAEELSRAHRLESLGVMAAGVAHDFNNLLVPIVANTTSILGDLPPTSLLRDRVEAIERAAQMASQLADQILASTGRSISPDEACDVAEVIRSMVPVLSGVVPDDVDLRFELAASAPARVDEESVAKLVTNLVVNAGQAIEGTGTVQVAVETSGEEVVLRISDDGVGMTPSVAARVTEPFFTTRATGRGLGLASLAGLLQSDTARLEVSTSVGNGTTMLVTFDSVAPVAEPPERPRHAPLPHADLSILLVDDDDMVRSSIHRLLEHMFATVHSVANAEQADAVLSDGTPVDCVIADLTMPDVRGPQTILRLRASRAGLPALLITGAGSTAARSELDAVGLVDVGVVTKPFTPTEVFHAVAAQVSAVVSG